MGIVPLFHESFITDPYENIALEQALAQSVLPGECLLYLWKNERTIVIGRNQNAWKECRVAEFEADGGRLARRLSGGGAVYHDIGNLNFTFAAHPESYDVEKHLEVICQAVRSFGLDAIKSGRNDLTIDGAKFSGNAFFQSKNYKCHHGTLLINVDMSNLAHYLTPDARKIVSKGIESVRSRVVNLADLEERITVDSLSKALIESFSLVYEQAVQPFSLERVDVYKMAQAQEKFASWEWRLGESQAFTYSFDERFSWGVCEIELLVEDGVVSNARINSDALDAEFILVLAEALKGCRYDCDDLRSKLETLKAGTSDQVSMIEGCLHCITKGM